MMQHQGLILIQFMAINISIVDGHNIAKED